MYMIYARIANPITAVIGASLSEPHIDCNSKAQSPVLMFSNGIYCMDGWEHILHGWMDGWNIMPIRVNEIFAVPPGCHFFHIVTIFVFSSLEKSFPYEVPYKGSSSSLAFLYSRRLLYVDPAPQIRQAVACQVQATRYCGVAYKILGKMGTA